jgi:chromosome segregation ATPase
MKLIEEKEMIRTVEETNAKLEANLKAAESKAETLSKELSVEKDTMRTIAEMNAKLEAKMKSNKKADKKEAQDAAEKFQRALDIVQQKLAAEKEITAQLHGLQVQLEESEQQLVSTFKSRDSLFEKLEEINGHNSDLKKNLAKSEENQDLLLQRINKLLERLDDKDAALSKITMEKSELFETLTASERLNTQLSSEIEALKNEQPKKSEEMNKLLDRLDESRRLLTVATAEKDQLRSMYGEYFIMVALSTYNPARIISQRLTT